MRSIFKTITKLCAPAAIYFTISILIILTMFFQNLSNNRIYKVGAYTKIVPNVMVIFIIKLLYTVFWTYILNLMCNDGNRILSWLLILFPFVLFFVIMGIFMLIPLGNMINPFNMTMQNIPLPNENIEYTRPEQRQRHDQNHTTFQQQQFSQQIRPDQHNDRLYPEQTFHTQS